MRSCSPSSRNPAIPKLAHNAKYDLTVCLRHGLEVDGLIHDTMIMAWVLDPGSRTLGLKDQAAAELGWRMTEITELIGSGRKQITMEDVAIGDATNYCGADVDATIRLYDILAARLQETGMWSLYTSLEVPLLPILTAMDMAGIQLDSAYLQQMSVQFAERLQALEQELFKIAGHEFNLRSTQQLSQVLFNELGFPAEGMKRTSSGHYSTAAAALEHLAATADDLTAEQKRVLDIIFEQRQLEKLRGTYIDALPALADPETGRVHTDFNQTGTVTGRVSSSNPNLQNIPIRTELGREIDARLWLLQAGACFPPITARSNCASLRISHKNRPWWQLLRPTRIFMPRRQLVSSKCHLEEVTHSQRSLAKTINYATIYGISEFGLSNRTEMSRREARRFLEQYFEVYPKIEAYIEATKEKAKREGFVETLMGRKRLFPELLNRRLPVNQRFAIERAAVNAPIQGTSADIMKLAMIHLDDRLKTSRYQARMLLQVHDELVLEVPEDECDAVVALVRAIMESAYPLSVPLKVDAEIGPDWYNLEPA